MDLQLNISYSNKDNKKKSSVSKNDNKDYKFLSKPKLEGKVLARKRQHQKDSTEEPHNKVLKFKKTDSKDDEVSTNLLDLSQNKGKFKGKNFQELNDDIKIKKVQSGAWISSLFKNNPDVPRMGQRAVKPLVEKVFSGNSFSDLEIHPHSVANLSQNLGLKELMTVQQQAVPIILQGRDVLIRSQTGSGKTLSYALPIVEGLQAIRPKINRNSGIKAVVVVPTRELAVQTFELFVKLVKPFTWIVPGLLSGGQKRKAEKARLRKGLCILVGTPGRINDHLRHTQSLNFAKAGCLVLDEADRLLDMGYEKDVAAIIKAIEDHKKAATYDPMALVRGNAPKKIINDDNDGHTSSKKIINDDDDTSSKEIIIEKNEKTHRLTEIFLSTQRQTTLLSATLTKAVENLAGLTMVDPVFVDTSEGRAIVADSLKHQPEATKSKKKENEVPSDDPEPDKNTKVKSSKNKLKNEENDEEETRGGLKPFRGAVMHPELFSTEVKNKKTEQSDSDSDYEYYRNEKEILENANKLESSVSENKASDSGFSEALKSAVIEDELILPATVNQSFLIVPMKLRLVTLCALIVQHCVLNKKGGKMIVFMATLEMVDYHSDLIETVLSGEGSDKKSNKKKNKKSNKTNEDKSSDESESEFHIDYEAPAEGGIVPVDIEMFKLHGSMPHEQRMEVFKQFRVARSGVLICTDVAARGIDVPHVDLVLQYCAPASATDYVHRVGRTGRAARVGEAIMFLLPSETEFVRYLEEKRIRLRQMNESNCLECLRSVVPTALSTQRAAIAVQAKLEHVAHGNRDWMARASRAYTSWVRFYSGYPRDVREYLDSKGLHLGHAAKAFALRETPAMLAKRAKLDPNLKKERPTNKLTVHEDEEAKRPGIPVAKLPKFGLPRNHNKQSSMHTASEFDSGLDAIDTGKPAKKKKKNK